MWPATSEQLIRYYRHCRHCQHCWHCWHDISELKKVFFFDCNVFFRTKATIFPTRAIFFRPGVSFLNAQIKKYYHSFSSSLGTSSTSTATLLLLQYNRLSLEEQKRGGESGKNGWAGEGQRERERERERESERERGSLLKRFCVCNWYRFGISSRLPAHVTGVNWVEFHRRRRRGWGVRRSEETPKQKSWRNLTGCFKIKTRIKTSLYELICSWKKELKLRSITGH